MLKLQYSGDFGRRWHTLRESEDRELLERIQEEEENQTEDERIQYRIVDEAEE